MGLTPFLREQNTAVVKGTFKRAVILEFKNDQPRLVNDSLVNPIYFVLSLFLKPEIGQVYNCDELIKRGDIFSFTI